MPNLISRWIAREADARDRENAAVQEAIAEATRTGTPPAAIKVSPIRAGKTYRRPRS